MDSPKNTSSWKTNPSSLASPGIQKGDELSMKMVPIISISILVVLSLSPIVSAWDIQNGIFREWAVEGVRPLGIETLPDGSVWITSDNSPSVFTLNRETGEPIVYTASFAGDFATMDRAPDNTLWISDENDRIVHFNPCDPSGDYFDDFPIPGDFAAGASPYGIRVAPDGWVWFTRWPDPSLGRYNPVTGDWDRFVLPEPDLDGDGDGDYPGTPAMITFDDEGNVWFTINSLITAEDRGGEFYNGNASFGRFDLTSETFTLYNDPSLFSPVSLTAPWEIAFTSFNPDILWFTDKSANYFFRVDLSGSSPVIEKIKAPYDTAPPEIWDTHFFAIDPDGIFWLAPFFTSNIGTFDPATQIFETRSLELYGSPMNIVVTPVGEVWWTIPGALASERRAVGCFIPFVDTDGDGIDDGIDSSPGMPSGLFSDGVTSGTFVEAGDQNLVITDATSPFGIRIFAQCDGGAAPAFISCCIPLIQSITMNPCDDIIVTCGSATIQVLAGPVEIELENGAVLTVPTRTHFTITELPGNACRIENIGCPYQGTVTIGEYTVAPGESLIITPPIAEANGPYRFSVGRPVAFSSAGSRDPDVGDSITYAWDFTNDGIIDSILANPSYTYTTRGTYTARLTVTDKSGLSATDTASVAISNAPVISSVSPVILIRGRTTNMAITGNYFQRGATVRLVNGGSIIPMKIKILTPPSKIGGSVTVPSSARGKYSVVITNPDGGTCTRANAVTIK